MGNFEFYQKELQGEKEAERVWNRLYDFFNERGLTEATVEWIAEEKPTKSEECAFLISNGKLFYKVVYGFKTYKDNWSTSRLELNVEFIGRIPNDIRYITRELDMDLRVPKTF